MKFKVMANCNTELYRLHALGIMSENIRQGSKMYYAMYAFETYGSATRDNSFEELVVLGKKLENEGDES